MSDVPPPPPTPPTPPVGPSPAGSAPPPEPDPTSLWGRYRGLPVWLQVLIPIVILAILIGIWVLATSDSDESASSDTTVAGSNMDDVLRGIIIAGGINGGTATTTTGVFTSEPATSTTDVTTTTEPATTLAPETTLAPTTTAGGDVPPPTATPTSAAPATTTTPPTTAATTTTEATPPTTDAPAGALPSPDDFLAQWNAAADGTDVPQLSRDQISEITQGPFAGAFLATLTPTDGSDAPEQVGLIGTMSADDPTQIAELLLVYVGGDNESASDFYWEAFGVLTQAVDPATTADQTSALETSLGRVDGSPPFPAGTADTADSNGFTYKLSTGETTDHTPATGIAVT
jgi:hypothetical protein